MRLVVGLGNPGRDYSGNRHNIGFMCVNHFAKIHGIRLDHSEGKARAGGGKIGRETVLLARPQTMMNLSGESVCRLVARHRVSLDKLIVVHDDMDLPTGKIRISFDSGSGGHKGINSIVACLDGRQDFVRLRIGIGRPTAGSRDREEAVIRYVLSDFAPAEREIILPALAEASEAILCLITEGLVPAMNRFN
ncbi:MAG: aminoacyl-tRNA hydrolase [Chloroflexota bacterium]